MPDGESAAPVPVPAPGWSGFYLGGDVGARITDPTWTTNGWHQFGQDCALAVLCNSTQSSNYALANSGTFDGIGARVGIYGGYNWQFAPS